MSNQGINLELQDGNYVKSRNKPTAGNSYIGRDAGQGDCVGRDSVGQARFKSCFTGYVTRLSFLNHSS